MSVRSWSHRADRWIQRNKLLTAAAAIGGLWYFFFRTPANAQPQPSPQPQPPSPLPPLPPPAPPGPPAQGAVVHHVPIIPGPFTLTVNDGDTLVFQLPLGAQWNVSETPSMYQAPGSVLGGILSPLIPTGTQIATWTDVTGTGTIRAEWVDLQGQAQESLINVTAAGAAHTL